MAITDVAPRDETDLAADALWLQNLKDYTSMAIALLWQRQIIYLAATLLTAFYFDPVNAAIFYCTILICEVQDLMIARRVAKLRPEQSEAIRANFVWIILNTIVSSAAICLYAVSVAFKQDAGGHFTPLFFLFAAALFAAMNNHQIVSALAIRLSMYGISFLVIVFTDIWIVQPSIESDLWLHFFTIIFVMYFLIDCSIVFLKLYRKNLANLEALRREHERTKAAYVVKSQFISTVSHELRTPLTSIKGSLDLLNSGAMGEMPEQMKKLVEIAGRNSQRLSVLIDDVLDLQKIEAGEMDYRSDVLNVAELVREAISSNTGYADAQQVKLVEALPDLPPPHIVGDEYRLLQVMANMISNAAKFSDVGGVVTVGFVAERDRVRIFVQDTGCGIAEGMEHKVFDRFSQIDSSDRRRAAGSGLGMNISKEIVDHHNGIIGYDSELGRGSTFYIELPLLEETARAS